MKYFLTFLILLFSVPVYAQTEGIAVVVNQDAISASDVNARLRLIMVTSGFPDNPEIKKRLLPQIIGALVEEQIKLQEAEREEVEVSQEEINNGFVQIAKQNSMEPEKFRNALVSTNVDIGTLERQIRSQLAWTKVVQKKFRSRVTISDSDIDSFVQRLEARQGEQEYLVAEIFLPVDEPDKQAEIQKLANNLSSQVRSQKASFFKLAQQFSKAPGAPQGGDLGWIQKDQLPEEIDSILPALGKGNVSEPIRTPGGYHIVLIREIRTITEENIPEREQVERLLGSQRLERMQARHLLNLKSSAFIENRV